MATAIVVVVAVVMVVKISVKTDMMAAVRFGTLTTGMFGFSFLRAGAYLTLATAATGM